VGLRSRNSKGKAVETASSLVVNRKLRREEKELVEDYCELE
jgi:hypothetical protein